MYDQANGHPKQGKWPFTAADESLPGCDGYRFKNVAPNAARSFYEYFLAQGKRGGMVAFEPDFMQQNYQCVREYIEELNAMPTWLAGLEAAALSFTPPIPIQFCMATPMQLLHSMRMPAVTNFRASNDYYYGGSYKIGTSSLLIWAVGQAPSKDTFVSTLT